MIPSSSIEAFESTPVGRQFPGRAFLFWCHSPTLRGMALWGRPNELDMRQVVRLLDLRTGLSPPIDVVTDVSRLESIDPAAFEVLSVYVRSRLADYATGLRRQAIVRPAGMPGAVAAGFYSVLDVSHRWKIFTTARAAFRWLNRKDAEHVHADVEAAIAEASGTLPVVRLIREQVERGSRQVTVAGAAKALGLSVRSLQRQLEQAKTSFRAEVNRARVRMAERLLVDSEEKLQEIARRVGSASLSNFSVLFHRSTGETPSAFRARHRMKQG